MTTVGIGFAHSLESLLQRFPSLRELGLSRLRRQEAAQSPGALASIIESEIIPRLLVAHLPAEFRPVPADGNAGSFPGDSPACGIAPEEVATFATRALDREVAELLEDIERLVARGIAADQILIDVLAPAARMLGVFWEEDRCDFVDVTMGLWRLQELTHDVAARMAPIHGPASREPHRRHAFLATLPGDQHQLGVLLVSEFFRAAGWKAVIGADLSEQGLAEAVAAESFDLIGLTVTQEWQLEALPALIESMRAASRNPGAVVMVGGGPVAARPELAFLVGADATAPDARHAVERAEHLVNAFGLNGARPC
jgi:methanogenic corrinoid protein MtbC1